MITVDDISVEVLLLTFIYLLAYSTYVHASNNTINVNPYPIVLNIPLSQTQEPIQKGLFITSGDNITKVQAYFTDLETTEEGKIWISKNSIRLIPKIFNVTSLRGTEANLLLDIHNHTGVYQGSMILQADHLKTTVPIKVNIYDFIPWPVLLVVAAGVFTAFFIKFMKIGIELRGSALEALERAENAAILARSEGKTFGSFRDGELEWLSAKTHLDNGRYRLARRRFERAISYYNAATATAPAVVQDLDPQRQPLTNQQISNIADQARSRGLIRLGLRDFDNIVFILSSVVLAIIIMQVWDQIYSQLQALSVGGLWFITAFLLGFGSESLVGETIEVTRIGQRR